MLVWRVGFTSFMGGGGDHIYVKRVAEAQVSLFFLLFLLSSRSPAQIVQTRLAEFMRIYEHFYNHITRAYTLDN